MPNTRELAQIIDRETGDVNNLRDKKLADATAQQQSGSASTDSVVMKTTGGEYVEIARDSFVGAIKGVMDGLIKGNSYTTLGANDPIAAFNSNALGGITPANLASVLGGHIVEIASYNGDGQSNYMPNNYGVYIQIKTNGFWFAHLFIEGKGSGTQHLYACVINWLASKTPSSLEGKWSLIG